MDKQNFHILDSTMDSIDVILNSDLIATRNSSVGADCWFLNTPVLFFVNGTLKRDNISYIPEDYLGTLVNEININELSETLPSIINDFYNHPMHKNYLIDEEDIVEELLK